MKYPKLVIFDCDGIITETAHLHYIAWKKIADEELNIFLSEEFLNKFRGLSRTDSLDIILKNDQTKIDLSEKDRERLIELKNNYYKTLITDKNNVKLFLPTIEFIKKLKTLNIKIAMASTSQNSKQLLKLHNIESFFDYLVNPNDIHHQKPSSEIFLKAINYFNFNPKECWGVEDAFVGIASINSSGAFSIGIGEDQQVKAANIVFEDINDLDLNKILETYEKWND